MFIVTDVVEWQWLHRSVLVASGAPAGAVAPSTASTEVVVTIRPGDAQQAAAEQGAQHDVLVAIGGDGTLNEVINGLEADRPVALCPVGTGNVLAKELRLPRRPEAFCKMVGVGREQMLDLASAGGRRFVSMAGVGFDAEVAAEIAARRRGAIHLLSYVAPIVRCFVRYGFPRLEVSVDGGAPVEAVGFLGISNVRAYGGPFLITPDASPSDGFLDVCALRRGSLLSRFRALFAFLVRLPRALSGAQYLRGRSIRVTADEPVRYQVDGDPAGFLPATFEILERKLRMIVP